MTKINKRINKKTTERRSFFFAGCADSHRLGLHQDPAVQRTLTGRWQRSSNSKRGNRKNSRIYEVRTHAPSVLQRALSLPPRSGWAQLHGRSGINNGSAVAKQDVRVTQRRVARRRAVETLGRTLLRRPERAATKKKEKKMQSRNRTEAEEEAKNGKRNRLADVCRHRNRRFMIHPTGMKQKLPDCSPSLTASFCCRSVGRYGATAAPETEMAFHSFN